MRSFLCLFALVAITSALPLLKDAPVEISAVMDIRDVNGNTVDLTAHMDIREEAVDLMPIMDIREEAADLMPIMDIRSEVGELSVNMDI
ncbi:hypothetical protein ONZ45_g14163 [Pleurotus djamor]|nr:hypothetical protein ONZ45_g14163 [Pleurotus djamor]